MKQFLLLLIFFLSACSIATSEIVSPSPAATLGDNPTGAVETYQIGEPVTFFIDDPVYVCNYFDDEIPYTIIQVTGADEREVALRHSCIGFIAQGVNEYCEDGKIKTEAVEIGKCSDDVICDETTIKETFTWNQQEYVIVAEECAGKMIQREVKQQAPEGKYKIVVKLQMDDGEIVTSVIEEFMITR